MSRLTIVARRLVVITGASGSGKTTLARYVQQRHPLSLNVILFDSTGIPPVEQMVRDYGTGEAWQRAATQAWMGKISKILSTGGRVLFEGQLRIAFVLEALAEAGITGARLVLFDCDDGVRGARLRNDRNQPKLANPTMMNWARHLREEAKITGVDVLDTSPGRPEWETGRAFRFFRLVPQRPFVRTERPVDAIEDVLMLDEVAPVRLLDAPTHSSDEPILVLEHPCNGVFHQLLGVLPT